MAKFVVGTLSYLAGKITLNGLSPTYQELSRMSRMFEGTLFRRVGTIYHEGPGRKKVVWEISLAKGAVVRAKVVPSNKKKVLTTNKRFKQAA